MSEGLNPSEDYLDRMAQFIMLSPDNGVNNFMIRKSRKDERIVFTAFDGLFVHNSILGGQRIAFASSLPLKPDDKFSYYSRILRLTLPEWIARMDLPDEPRLRQRSGTSDDS